MIHYQKHNELIKEQFSMQAKAYTSIKAHSEALDLIIELSGVTEKDDVLDVACGSGIVACAFAKYARHVTGIDITENMLQSAHELQEENGLKNIQWVLDDVLPLRIEDEQFSIVVTRFSFHHFINYEKVFDEMVRVCKSGGTVMVIDVALEEDKVKAYDAMEKLRDPSHAGILSISKFNNLFDHNCLTNVRRSEYKMQISLNDQLSASFPSTGDRELLRSMIIRDTGINNIGIEVKLIEGNYQLFYPIHIYAGQKK